MQLLLFTTILIYAVYFVCSSAVRRKCDGHRSSLSFRNLCLQPDVNWVELISGSCLNIVSVWYLLPAQPWKDSPVLSLQANTTQTSDWAVCFTTNLSSIRPVSLQADGSAVPLRGHKQLRCLVFPVQLPDLLWPPPCFSFDMDSQSVGPLRATSWKDLMLDTCAAWAKVSQLISQLVTASSKNLEPSYAVLLKQSSALLCLKPSVAWM